MGNTGKDHFTADRAVKHTEGLVVQGSRVERARFRLVKT